MQTTLKILTLVGKGLGLLGSLNTVPGLSPEKAVLVFFVASIAKDVINRVGDYLDDGKENNSFGSR